MGLPDPPSVVPDNRANWDWDDKPKQRSGRLGRLIVATAVVGGLASATALAINLGGTGPKPASTAVGKVVEGLTQDAPKNCLVFTTLQEEPTREQAEATALRLANGTEGFDYPAGARLVEHQEAIASVTASSGDKVYLVAAAAEVCITPPQNGALGP